MTDHDPTVMTYPSSLTMGPVSTVHFEINFGPYDNISRPSTKTLEDAEARIEKDADGEITTTGLARVKENYRIVKVTTTTLYEEVETPVRRRDGGDW